ncbi:MAG: hypothetical protein WCG66_11455 [bacterium]
MIRLPLLWLVFTALFIFLSGILLTWICYEIAHRRREARKLRGWTRCTLCAFHFKAEPSARLQICPQCGAKNEYSPIKPL